MAAAQERRRHGREHDHRDEAGLSAQELRIALLVADGLSDREIGRRLLLSPRTIG
jgi:DNA-binding CsgD family transcriptional regulator